MKSIYQLLLIMGAMTTLVAQTIQERIRDIQSFADVERFVVTHTNVALTKVQMASKLEKLPKGLERNGDSILIKGEYVPHLIGLNGLLRNTLMDDPYFVSNLLKRGFPEEDVPHIEYLMKQNIGELERAHYFTLLNQKMQGTPLKEYDLQDIDWLKFGKTEQGHTFLQDRAQVRDYFDAQDQARQEAMQVAVVELLVPLKIQSIRVLLSYVYELIAPNTSMGYYVGGNKELNIEKFVNYALGEK